MPASIPVSRLLARLLVDLPYALIAFRPHRIEESTLVHRLARRWVAEHCASPPSESYACPMAHGPICRFPASSRRYCHFVFGPIGWSGGPEEMADADLQFLGVRRDAIGFHAQRRRHGVMAHEMTHERQRYCNPAGCPPLSFRTVLALELEAERAGRHHMAGPGFSLKIQRLVAYVAGLSRATLSSSATAFHPSAILVVVLLSVALTISLCLALPAWMMDHPIPQFGLQCLFYGGILVLIQRFFASLRLAWHVARATPRYR